MSQQSLQPQLSPVSALSKDLCNKGTNGTAPSLWQRFHSNTGCICCTCFAGKGGNSHFPTCNTDTKLQLPVVMILALFSNLADSIKRE